MIKYLTKSLRYCYNRRHFKQTCTNRHLIAAGHKKDLTSSFAHCIIGASNEQNRIVTLLLAPPRQNIDYDQFSAIGHTFLRPTQKQSLTYYWRPRAKNICQDPKKSAKFSFCGFLVFGVFHVEH